MTDTKKHAITRATKIALIKLLLAIFALVGVTLICFSKIDRGLTGLLATVAVLVLLPMTILFSIDASRAIKNDAAISDSASLKTIGTLLGIPRAILGVALLAIGVAYPLIAVTKIAADIPSGYSYFLQFVLAIISAGMLTLGYFYLREGLGLSATRTKPKRNTHGKRNGNGGGS
jgi:hypothetical protein